MDKQITVGSVCRLLPADDLVVVIHLGAGRGAGYADVQHINGARKLCTLVDLRLAHAGAGENDVALVAFAKAGIKAEPHAPVKPKTEAALSEVTDELGTEWWAQADELSERVDVGTFPFLNPGAGRI